MSWSFLLVVLGIAVWSDAGDVLMWRRAATWVRTPGTVTDVRQQIEPVRDHPDRRLTVIRYRFTRPDGSEGAGEDTVADTAVVGRGDPIEVLVDPRRGDRSMLPRPRPRMPVRSLLAIGSVLVAAAWWLVERSDQLPPWVSSGAVRASVAVSAVGVVVAGCRQVVRSAVRLRPRRGTQRAIGTVVDIAQRVTGPGQIGVMAAVSFTTMMGQRTAWTPVPQSLDLFVGQSLQVAVGPGPDEVAFPAKGAVAELIAGVLGVAFGLVWVWIAVRVL